MNIQNFLLLLVVFGTSLAKANGVPISERTVELRVDISSTKLKWSQADYSSPVLKVLVPDLATVTILDHRNTGEGAPCMATYQAMSPEEVIQNNPSVEVIPMTITLQKQLSPDPKDRLCHVALKESIVGEIRGFRFEHQKIKDIGTRHMDDCR